jgi:hypothetical protein
MKKEEILQLKEEVMILSDYPEVEENDVRKRLISLKETTEREYNSLSKDDQLWVDYNFNQWLDFYLGNSCTEGCSGCSCEDYE